MSNPDVLPGDQPLTHEPKARDEADYYVRAGVTMPTVYDLAVAENNVREQSVVPYDDALATSLALMGLLTQIDPMYGISTEPGAR